MKLTQLLYKIRRTIDRYGLLEKGDRMVVGVSAGVDSMVLLHLLNALRQDFSLTLIVAHLNHGLRPQESLREVEFVQKESDRLGLIFEYQEVNVRSFQKIKKISLQEAARQVRFQFFHDLCQKYSAGKIALGHHADDQVETLLLRLFRGSGLQGLKGMLPIREGRIIRPLLEVWKDEIESVAFEHSIPYLMDSSNLKKDYLRNRIRLNLIPLIEKEYQKGFRRNIFRSSILLRGENAFMDEEAEKAFREIVHQEDEESFFNLSEFRSLHPALRWRVIQKVLGRVNRRSNETDWDVREVNLIHQALQKPSASFRIPLSRGLICVKRYERVSIKRGEPKTIPPFDVELQCPGRTYLSEIGKEIILEEWDREEQASVPPSRTIAFLDYERLQWPLRVRNFRPGDRFWPMGTPGTQKLKEFFINHKVPKFERPGIPLLVSGDKIVWVIGYRLDERFKATPATPKILKVELS